MPGIPWPNSLPPDAASSSISPRPQTRGPCNQRWWKSRRTHCARSNMPDRPQTDQLTRTAHARSVGYAELILLSLATTALRPPHAARPRRAADPVDPGKSHALGRSLIAVLAQRKRLLASVDKLRGDRVRWPRSTQTSYTSTDSARSPTGQQTTPGPRAPWRSAVPACSKKKQKQKKKKKDKKKKKKKKKKNKQKKKKSVSSRVWPSVSLMT